MGDVGSNPIRLPKKYIHMNEFKLTIKNPIEGKVESYKVSNWKPSTVKGFTMFFDYRDNFKLMVRDENILFIVKDRNFK